MKYKIHINSTPDFTTTVTARTVQEAKRIALGQANLTKIRVLYSDEIEVEELDIVAN